MTLRLHVQTIGKKQPAVMKLTRFVMMKLIIHHTMHLTLNNTDLFKDSNVAHLGEGLSPVYPWVDAKSMVILAMVGPVVNLK